MSDNKAPADTETEVDAVDLGVGADVHAAKLKPKADKTGKSKGKLTTTFYSYIPDLRVLQADDDGIDAESIRFEGGFFEADDEDKEFLLNHRFYELERYDLIEDTIVVGGKVQSIRRLGGRIQKEITDGKQVFVFEENPNLKLLVSSKDGLSEIRFDDGYAAVGKKDAEIVRAHPFYVEGRIKEVTQNRR